MPQHEANKKNIIIHIGMPRAASTFLQANLFPNLPETRFLAQGDNPAVECINQLIKRKIIDFDVVARKKRVNDYLASLPEKNIVLSHEGLFGRIYDNFINHKQIAVLLKEIFPEAKILLMVRKQDDLLESIYKLSLYHGFSRTVNGFLNYRSGTFHRGKESYFGLNLDVYELKLLYFVRQYKSLFEENLFVFPMEMLKKEKKLFLENIHAMLELESSGELSLGEERKRNNLMTSLTGMVLLIFNRFRYRAFNGCGFIVEDPFAKYFQKQYEKSSFHKNMYRLLSRMNLVTLFKPLDLLRVDFKFINRKKREKIIAIHAEENKELSRLIGMDLSTYGYHA